jgi:phosphatidylglycerophosphate synthase
VQERFYLLAPPLLLLALLCVTFLIYCGLCAIGKPPNVGRVKHNQLFGEFMARYLVWLIQPIERLLVGRVSPNTITALSLGMCAACGVAAGLGQIGVVVWLFTFAGILDIIDGRLARLQNKTTESGALFDSVSDRWGELFVFTGYAWYMRDNVWLLAVMAAAGGSMMVSYTRARAEGLKVELSGGMMQRAERIFIVVSGTLLAAWYTLSPDPETAVHGTAILGGTLSLVAITSTATAINRWIMAYKVLASATPEAREGRAGRAARREARAAPHAGVGDLRRTGAEGTARIGRAAALIVSPGQALRSPARGRSRPDLCARCDRSARRWCGPRSASYRR